MCNFFQKSESSKYQKKRFGYPDPYPVPFQSRFWISVSGCKLTILPHIQPANRIVIISVGYIVSNSKEALFTALGLGIMYTLRMTEFSI